DDRDRAACTSFLIELVVEIPGQMRAEVSQPYRDIRVRRVGSNVAKAEQISGAADTHFRAEVFSANGLEEGSETHGARALPKDRRVKSHVGVPGVERRERVLRGRVFAERRPE